MEKQSLIDLWTIGDAWYAAQEGWQIIPTRLTRTGYTIQVIADRPVPQIEAEIRRRAATSLHHWLALTICGLTEDRFTDEIAQEGWTYRQRAASAEAWLA
jgi:hypothetical protein